MNEEKAVIAIYDVRGIQDYIFRTNKLKEIIGGSKIVEKLIIRKFEEACNTLKGKECPESDIITNWKDQDYKFDKDPNIKIEVLYYGGGNLVVLFRTKDLYEKVSKLMSKQIMKDAYGLSLVSASVEKTENYNEDWRKLKERLSEIKAVTPPNKTAGVLPIVQYDRVSGKPLSKVYVKENEKVTYEAYQKLNTYDEEIPKEKIPSFMKEFDKMRTSKDEGLIAIVHIDGNNMGMSIGNIMKDVNSYEEAVQKTRKISKDIHEVFEKKAINSIIDNIGNICRKHNIKIKNKELPFRPLIQAGDDITFVCNARIALDIVKEYINTIRDGYMWSQEYKFSACAGIAIIHAHYPFYKGYQIAEECCKSAKERAKNEGKVGGKTANFVDFEYCYSGNRTNLELSRKENYISIEGNSLLRRPYGIYNSNDNEQLKDEQKLFDLKTFEADLKLFKGISRTTAKAFRDAYYETESIIKYNLLRHGEKNNIKYRDPFVLINNEKHAKYYDALEMLDIWGIEDKGAK